MARGRKSHAAGLGSGVSVELRKPQDHNATVPGTDSRYKFRLDLDGFAWTTRWKRELSTGSVVLKATLYVSGRFHLCALLPWESPDRVSSCPLGKYSVMSAVCCV